MAYGSDPGPLMHRLEAIEPLVARDARAHARVLAALAVGNRYNPDPSVANSLSARAIALAESTGEPDVIADALLGRVLAYTGVSEKSYETIALLDRLAGVEHKQGDVDDAIRHAVLAMAYFNLGEVDTAAEHARLGAAVSDLQRLRNTRVQTRWMEHQFAVWRGSLETAEGLLRTAAELHDGTELYGSGSTDLAQLSVLWERGRITTEAARATPEPGPWLAAEAAARGDAATALPLIREQLARDGAPNWTTLGHLVLVAHAIADLGLREEAARILPRLEPHADRIANIGQVGLVGCVAHPLARLRLLLDDVEGARELNEAAARLAWRTGGAPQLLRCRMLRVELGDEPPAVLAEIAEEAAAIGLDALAASARAALPV
jgi:hypothetical protein